MLQMCTFTYSSLTLSITSPTDGTRTWPSYLIPLTMRAQHSLPMHNKRTRTVKRLQRPVYAREGAADVHHQALDSHIH